MAKPRFRRYRWTECHDEAAGGACHVYVVGQDVILEAILEHHDVVVRDRAADQCAHGASREEVAAVLRNYSDSRDFFELE